MTCKNDYDVQCFCDCPGCSRSFAADEDYDRWDADSYYNDIDYDGEDEDYE